MMAYLTINLFGAADWDWLHLPSLHAQSIQPGSSLCWPSWPSYHAKALPIRSPLVTAALHFNPSSFRYKKSHLRNNGLIEDRYTGAADWD